MGAPVPLFVGSLAPLPIGSSVWVVVEVVEPVVAVVLHGGINLRRAPGAECEHTNFREGEKAEEFAAARTDSWVLVDFEKTAGATNSRS